MTAKDAILRGLDMGEHITKLYVQDLSPAELLIRPVPGQNHVAWQLGHLLMTERAMLESIKPGVSPALPEGFEEGHGRDKHGVDDPSKYHSAEQYLGLLAAQRAATKAALESLDDAALDAPSAERFQKMAPTVGSVFVLNGNHHLMHVGQYVAVRRKAGKPIAF